MTDVQKVSPNLRGLVGDEMAAFDSSDEIQAIISSAVKLTQEQQDELKRLGIRIRSQIGKIATAKIPLSALGRMTELEFIDYVEGSTPMWMEKKTASGDSDEGET